VFKRKSFAVLRAVWAKNGANVARFTEKNV
jgi:hypothetical protein